MQDSQLIHSLDMDYTRPSLALGIESIRKSKGGDVKLRYITESRT
jgi:hypothetical protein